MPVMGSSHRLASKATGPMDTGRPITRPRDRQRAPMAVHQLIPSFVAGDATGQAALHLQLLLRRLGHSGELYAAEVGSGLDSLAHPVSALRPAPEDLVLYHHGIASPLSSRLMHLPCRRGVVFHNISPASAYAGTPLAEPLLARPPPLPP